MNARPLHDRLIVRRLEEGEQQIGGIIIPDSAKEKPQRGTVIAVGNGRVNKNGTRVPLDVKAGDLILREDEVFAVIEGVAAKPTN